jgi:hypothetical protein
VSAEEFIEPWRQGKGLYFVDVMECSANALENWLKKLNVSDLAISLCIKQRKTSLLVPLADEVIFELPVCLVQLETETGAEAEVIDH